MPPVIPHRQPARRRGPIVLLWLILTVSLAAQSSAPPAPAQFDPSDVYFQGYLAARATEQLETTGDFQGALEKLERANQLFQAIRTYHPDWKADMVNGRSQNTSEAINRVRPLAEQAINQQRSALAELEGGTRTGASDPDPALPPPPGILEINPLANRRLQEAEKEIQRLQKLLDRSGGESANAELRRQRDDLQARLRATEATANELRGQLAAAPMEQEMSALGRRIEALEQEREAMALALGQSRNAHSNAQARINSLENELGEMRQREADLRRDLETERNVANSVVAGQRRQLDALEKDLRRKNEELATANQQIAGLMRELQESRDAFAQLRDERDSLMRERDQMAALLKLNEASRIQELIEQNMALNKNLREANEKVDRMHRENNADKDTYTDALRDLAIAKSQINRLLKEKRDQDLRLADLEKRLKSEENALAQGLIHADPAEIEMLRDIIRRQLRVQERRRQARDLLIAAAKELGSGDERLAQAIELFNIQEIALSPEEQRLIADREVDGEFISPFARDPAAVGRANSELQRDISAFERTAEKSFLAGRLLPTRELYQMILEQNPGHSPTLCRLGVVHLKLNDGEAAVDSFRRAAELDSSNAYAQRMLAFSLMHIGDIPAAGEPARRAVELAPVDARNHMLMAAISYRLGRSGEAESHFKAAINADPMPSEPYYNLALLCSRDQRYESARTYYQQALERGALPDPELEKKITKP
jgi:predicted  nucleic acid-binding Zn-ribbon protein